MAENTAVATEAEDEAGTENETPREKFVRLASGRTTKALAAIESIRGLANQDRYEYTEEDTAKIVAAIESETLALKADLERGYVERGPKFSL